MVFDKHKYNQEYYKINKEKLLKNWKKRYHSLNSGTKESVLKYQKKYRERNKEKIKKTNKEYSNRLHKEVIKLLGTKCIICNEDKHHRWHEIYGKPHPYGTNSRLLYIINHSQDFACLCNRCHDAIHKIAKNITKLEKYLELIRKL